MRNSNGFGFGMLPDETDSHTVQITTTMKAAGRNKAGIDASMNIVVDSADRCESLGSADSTEAGDW